MATKITDKDNGYQKMLKFLTKDKQPALLVGVFGEKGTQLHEDSELTVAEIGAFHEFGLGNNPERSFIRGWVDENEDKTADFLKRECERAIKSGAEDFVMVLERLGLYVSSGMQARISEGIPPELKKATIRRKGSSTPLINTGQLRSSITYKVQE